MVNFKLVGQDDLQLNVNKYVIEEAKGVVICVHGMCEHSKRYERFANELNQAGYSVYTYDHRGHGNSLLNAEKLGYMGKDGFNKFVFDLDTVVTFVKEKHPHLKVYLLGHSMGSFITERYIQVYNKVDGVILSGSNYGTKALGLGITVGSLACLFKGDKTEGKLLAQLSFGAFNNQFKPNRTAFDWLNRDTNEVDLYVADPFCGFVCSNRFYLDFFKGLKTISKKENIAKINPELPVLIVSGSQDPVGNNGKGVQALFDVYSQYLHHIEMKLFEGARHEILLEENKQEVYHTIKNWLESNH